MTHHTSVQIPGLSIVYTQGIFVKTTKIHGQQYAHTRVRLPALQDFSNQHTKVCTIAHNTLALCSDCLTRIIICALLISRAPEYHCATPLASKSLAAENTTLLKTISIVTAPRAPTMFVLL